MSKPRTFNFAKIDQDWIEIFAAGRQVDSAGNAKDWTDEELGQMASNFDVNDKFPVVIGHPKTDSPAHGWGQAVKAEAGKLYAKLGKFSAQFLKWGRDGHIRNRSLKIIQTPKGFKIAHLGFLGAAQPAVEGMEAVEFSQDAGQVFEFAVSMSYPLTLIGRFFRRLRERTIETDGSELADRLFPLYDVEHIEQVAAEASADERANRALFNSNLNPEDESMSGNTPKTFTQADLDKAAADSAAATEAKLQPKLKAAEFTTRVLAAQAFVDGLINDKDGKCRLTPAQATGVAEFLSALEGIEAPVAEFSFTAADKAEKKVSLAQFAKDLLSALPVQLQTGRTIADVDPKRQQAHSFAAPSGCTVDPARVDLDRKANEYMRANPGTDYLTAVAAVEQSA